jgi:hypothetical protein
VEVIFPAKQQSNQTRDPKKNLKFQPRMFKEFLSWPQNIQYTKKQAGQFQNIGAEKQTEH